MAARIARGVATWVSTGQIPSDIPDEMKTELPGGGLAGAVGGALSSVVGAVGGALSAIGHLFFKGAPGGARSGADPAGLSARLGPGRPLDPPVRQRMESAFEHGLGEVRVHDDSTAAGAPLARCERARVPHWERTSHSPAVNTAPARLSATCCWHMSWLTWCNSRMAGRGTGPPHWHPSHRVARAGTGCRRGGHRGRGQVVGKPRRGRLGTAGDPLGRAPLRLARCVR